jgi:hypothetical protein
VKSSDDEGGNAGGESDDGSVVEVPVPLHRDSSDDDDEKSGLSLNSEKAHELI